MSACGQNDSFNRKRRFLKFVAYLQVMGILLVVFGHSFHEYPDGLMGRSLLIYRMMYSFRMPLFMFVSGFLMVYTNFMYGRNTDWLTFTGSKIKRLLIPYFFLSLVTFVPRASLSYMADDKIVLSAESLVKALFYGGEGMVIPLFWFLQASFILLVTVHLIVYLTGKAGIKDEITFPALIVAAVALLVLPFESGSFFSISEVVRLALFFTLGASYCRFHEKIDGYVRWTSPWILSMAALLWVVSFFLTERSQWSAVCSVFGIAMCVSAAKMFEKKNITVLDPLIGANYMIFLLSWYFNVLSQQVLGHFVDLPWWVHTIVSLSTAVFFPWFFYRTICRFSGRRWASMAALLLGQSLRTEKKYSDRHEE